MPITTEQARRFYDRFGARQDASARFEDLARDALVELADFEHAHAVFELGFGTGRFAQRLFQRHLPADARYVGQDVSSTMHALARARLEPWADRVTLRCAGALALPDADAGFDRFVATYVLDLMPVADIEQVLREAHRVLAPGGLLGLVSLGRGERPLSRAIAGLWHGIASLAPQAVGGCRPLDLGEFVGREDDRREDNWLILANRVITAYAVPSQVLVARRA
jgi:ubiquinone/menaquinone biosynthesis C-methylase UbiE